MVGPTRPGPTRRRTRGPAYVYHRPPERGPTPGNGALSLLRALLLAEVQRLERERQAQAETIASLVPRIAALEAGSRR